MSDSQNLSVAGYADDAPPSSLEVERPNQEVISSSDEENENQTQGDLIEVEGVEVIDVEQPIDEPSTSTAKPTEVLDIVPLDTSTFTIQPVALQPTQNTFAPRNLTPFPSPFPSVLLLPPPDSSATLATDTTPSFSSTPANISLHSHKHFPPTINLNATHFTAFF